MHVSSNHCTATRVVYMCCFIQVNQRKSKENELKLKNKMTMQFHWMVTSSIVTSISPSPASCCPAECIAACSNMKTIDAPAQYYNIDCYM